MTIKNQAIKNAALVQELAMYIAKNPKAVKKTPKRVAYVAFSAEDAELNEENEKMLQSVIAEGRKVIKAVKTNDKDHPWQFFPVTLI